MTCKGDLATMVMLKNNRKAYIIRGHNRSSIDMNSSAIVWESFFRSDETVVTTEEVHRAARRAGKNPHHAVRHLRREGYLLPLFKGYYYVRSPEELRLGTSRYNPLELFALAANAKGIGAWYFGLHTALRLNGLTHEDRREETVVATDLYRIEGVKVGTGRFVVHKWSEDLAGFGLLERGLLRYSDPEKTVLDLAYLDHWRKRRGDAPRRTWAEHVDHVDAAALRGYLDRYPDGVREMVEARL